MASNELALQALSSFENLIRDTFVTKATNESNREMELASFLFKNEYELQQQNIATLNQLGLALPEEVQTDNFKMFADSAGNSNTMEALGALYAQSKFNNEQLNTSINEYSQGVALSQRLRKQGVAADTSGIYGPRETATDPGYYQFSPEETTGLISEYPGLEGDAYRAGFDAGNLDLTKAMDTVAKVQQMYILQRQINEGDLQSAQASYLPLTSKAGRNVIFNMQSLLQIPISSVTGAYGITDPEKQAASLSMLTSIENAIKGNKLIPNISSSIISALQDLASPSQNTSKFTDLAADAYALVSKNTAKENSLINAHTEKGIVLSRLDAQNMLNETDEDYRNNSMLLREYASAGIVSPDTREMQEAYLISDVGDKIVQGQIVMASQTAARFGEIDLPTFEELLDEYDPTEGVDYNLDEFSKIKNTYYNTGKIADLELDVPLGSVELTKLIGELETQQAVETTAMGEFRSAASKLQALWPELAGPAEWGDTGVALGARDRGGIFFDKLPSEGRMTEIKNKLQQMIVSVQKSQPSTGALPGTTGLFPGNVPVEKAKKINLILNIWNDYLSTWEVALKETGVTQVRTEALQLGG